VADRGAIVTPAADEAVALGAVERRVTRIQPRRGRARLDLASLWAYRELLYFFVWRDVKVRYRQTVLGALWAVLQPVITMVVFTVVFGHLADVPSDGLPYPLFTLAALVPWMFFSTGVSQAANSLVNSQNLLKRVYFPRLVIPTAAVTTGLVDLAFSGLVLAALMVFYGVAVTPAVVLVVPLLLLAYVSALAVGLWLSAINVRYRDVRYVVPFLLQVWLFATPTAYPSSLLDEPWRTLSALNPMVGVVEGCRWALLGADTAPGPLVLASTATTLLVLVTGAYYFRRVEGTLADVV
jgi:lipopolysaccharide transport system permease protein